MANSFGKQLFRASTVLLLGALIGCGDSSGSNSETILNSEGELDVAFLKEGMFSLPLYKKTSNSYEFACTVSSQVLHNRINMVSFLTAKHCVSESLQSDFFIPKFKAKDIKFALAYSFSEEEKLIRLGKGADFVVSQGTDIANLEVDLPMEYRKLLATRTNLSTNFGAPIIQQKRKQYMSTYHYSLAAEILIKHNYEIEISENIVDSQYPKQVFGKVKGLNYKFIDGMSGGIVFSVDPRESNKLRVSGIILGVPPGTGDEPCNTSVARIMPIEGFFATADYTGSKDCNFTVSGGRLTTPKPKPLPDSVVER
jgi:hypothetical protein